MRFEILGNVPSKKNSKRMITRDRRGYTLDRPKLLSSQNHEDWHLDASWQLKAQKRPIEPIKKAMVIFTIYAGDKRKADLSNKWESVADLLVDMGIFEDDNWFVLDDVHMRLGGVDKENPRAVIEIYEEK